MPRSHKVLTLSDEAKMSSLAEERNHIHVAFVESPSPIPVPKGDIVSCTQAKSLSPAQNAVFSLPA